MNQSLATFGIEDVMPAALATGLFVSLCTIQEPSGTMTADGTPDNTFVDIDGLVDIRCMLAPTSISNISATEAKSERSIESFNSGHVLLESYYPTIGPNSQWRAVIDGVAYDILGAENDSQSQMTRLLVQVVTV